MLRKKSPKHSHQEQYNIGVEASKELKKCINILPLTMYLHGIQERQKHKNYMDAYLKCGIKVKNDQKIINLLRRIYTS